MASEGEGLEGTIYFERQTRLLCGLHVMNNLVRRFSLTNTNPESHSNIFLAHLTPHVCFQFGKAEFTVAELDAFAKTAGTGSVFGYYDLNTLQLAADSRNCDISFFDARRHVDDLPMDDPMLLGFLVNITSSLLYFFKSKHWVCIRKLPGENGAPARWYHLDSKGKRPELVEEDKVGPLLAQLRNHGAQLLVVTKKATEVEADAATVAEVVEE